jgi:hypothetical protein
MVEPPGPVSLDLAALPVEAELSRPVAEALALAASVVLDRLHGAREGDAAILHGHASPRTGELRRVPVDAAARATYADPQEATEEGGEGVAVVVARRVLDRIVFRRLPKGTGADYFMRDPEVVEGDTYERLECSGIEDGQETAAARLRSKLEQLARFPKEPPGWAVVTSFRMEPVEVRFGSWRG